MRRTWLGRHTHSVTPSVTIPSLAKQWRRQSFRASHVPVIKNNRGKMTKEKPNVPNVWMWLAKYISSSRTEMLIWYGLTQSCGLVHSTDFSSLSLSVLSSGIALNRITITRSSRQTLSAWRRQSIRRIFPFWSGFERTQSVVAALPVLIHCMKPSRHSWVMSFRNFASRRIAHFWRTSTASLCEHNTTILY